MIDKDILLNFIQTNIKTCAKLLREREKECPKRNIFILEGDGKFLSGLSIGHWEGKIEALKEMERQLRQDDYI